MDRSYHIEYYQQKWSAPIIGQYTDRHAAVKIFKNAKGYYYEAILIRGGEPIQAHSDGLKSTVNSMCDEMELI